MAGVISGITLGLGLVLILTTALPRRPALRDILAAPYRAPQDVTQDPDEAGGLVRAGRGAVPLLRKLGLPTEARLHDLRVVDRAPEEHLATQAACAGSFLLLGAAYPTLLHLAGINLPLPLSTGICVLGGIVGFVVPDRKMRIEAEKIRADLRYATSNFLTLAALMLAGGAGLEEALISAAEAGNGVGHDQLRTALALAQTSRKPIWDTLGQLGEHAGVDELRQLAALAALAGGEGASIRATLKTRAQAMRSRLAAEQEAAAAAATERAVIPTALLMAGYVALVTFPAVLQAVHNL